MGKLVVTHRQISLHSQGPYGLVLYFFKTTSKQSALRTVKTD